MTKILWVDDEIDLLKSHIYFLEEKGYEVVAKSSGKDAIEFVKQNNVDVILLDEMMPGLDGLSTLELIKDIKQNIPVIMITKSEEEGLMDQAISKHIADYLLKPVNPKQILLALKKNLDKRKIIKNSFGQKYAVKMRELNARLYEEQTPELWIEIYKKIVQLELEIENLEQADYLEAYRFQKSEFGSEFAKFVEKNYLDWLQAPQNRPTLSQDIMKKYVFPKLKENPDHPIYFVLLDCARLDQFNILEQMLNDVFSIKKEYYYSILPTATPYSRNAIFSGLMPLEIWKNYPQYWSESNEPDVSLNRYENQLLQEQLKRNKINLSNSMKYLKIHELNESKNLVKKIASFGNIKFVSIVLNFIDTLTHGRSHNEILREIAPDEAALRSITKSWFIHSKIFDAFKVMKEQKATVILTSDHGSILCNKPTKIVGRKDTSTTLRYKFGQNLNYDPQNAFNMENPQKYFLKANDISDNYILAKNDCFFVYPNQYHEYVRKYEGSFQHGGISLEEMILPIYLMES